MLERLQFEVLRACERLRGRGFAAVCERVGLDAAAVKPVFDGLVAGGFVDENGCVTEDGLSALKPFKVQNAVILAAGRATRLAPLSFELPKALFKVRGDILIERAIRQLQEAGIDDITVVVGHMKESLFYLEEAFGVRLVVNIEYADRNSNSSMYAVRPLLGNTYVCACDQYFTMNPFERYEYAPRWSVVSTQGATDEWAVTVDDDDVVTSIKRGGDGPAFLRGPVYLDKQLSKSFVSILEREYRYPATAAKVWEDIVAEHIDELRMLAKEYPLGSMFEFDSFDDLREFDADFFENVDSAILDNICRTLGCERNDVTDVAPLTAGLSNLSVVFSCKGQRYVYRHPGAGTDEVVNREAETWSQHVAERLGLDATFVYEDSTDGWKISRFVQGCESFDYGNREQVAQALGLIRKLHESGETSPWSFDYAAEASKIVDLLREMRYPQPADFPELTDAAMRLASNMEQDQVAPALCHNDFYGPNILVRGDDMWLIDWEYSAMGDPTCDVGNFVSQGSGYTVEEAIGILDLYYGRKPTEQETRHCLAAIGLVGYYWYVWGVFKEAKGDPVGEWLYIWYKAAKRFIPPALALYENEGK